MIRNLDIEDNWIAAHFQYLNAQKRAHKEVFRKAIQKSVSPLHLDHDPKSFVSTVARGLIFFGFYLKNGQAIATREKEAGGAGGGRANFHCKNHIVLLRTLKSSSIYAVRL